MKRSVLISDPTLRDGNHAARHQISLTQVASYCQAADRAGIPIVEVGHGNGLGGSSLLVGELPHDELEMLRVARSNLKKSRLGIHFIPGFGTARMLGLALDAGVDVVRVASHCTEANITRKHIAYVREKGRTVHGVLMMSHMAPIPTLVEEAKKLEEYGAEAVVIMDSAGAYLPDAVTERISALRQGLKIDVGFHGHNNLSMAVANSIAAARAGALIIDGTSRGFGAGAGNTQLEVLIATLEQTGFETGIDLYAMLDLADLTERELIAGNPVLQAKISSVSIVSGLAGVFSGYVKPVEAAARQYGLDPRDIFFELGRRRVVAGQEDVIKEVAIALSTRATGASA